MINLVVDIDGTIANNEHRQTFIETHGKKDWDSFYNLEKMWHDTPYPDAQPVFRRIIQVPNLRLVFLTGRPNRTRGVTARWLLAHYGVTVENPTPHFFQSYPAPGRAVLWTRGDNDWRGAHIYKEQAVAWMLLKAAPAKDGWVFIDDDTRCYDAYGKLGVVLQPPQCWGFMR